METLLQALTFVLYVFGVYIGIIALVCLLFIAAVLIVVFTSK